MIFKGVSDLAIGGRKEPAWAMPKKIRIGIFPSHDPRPSPNLCLVRRHRLGFAVRASRSVDPLTGRRHVITGQ